MVILNKELHAASAEKSVGGDALKNASAFTFSDKTGARVTLYLVPQSSARPIQPERFELPPAPGDSVFDIRFASNRFAEVVDPSGVAAMPVILRGVTPPVMLEWNVYAMNVSLQTGGGRTPLTGAGRIPLNNGGSSFSLVTGASAPLPAAFALDQNYPDPFNPVTLIRYTLPARVGPTLDPPISMAGLSVYPVSLKVYDLLGQLVATLVNESKAPGEYSAQWDATNVPSGIYYYRLVAGDFSDVKKMIYLK
jgi:hypothetical protein